jgi:hypothetical protein
LSNVLHRVYDTDVGLAKVSWYGKDMTLRELFDRKLVSEFSPESDQIGRCTDEKLAADWNKGVGREWLMKKLACPATDNDSASMLTKLRAFNGFGAII